MDGLDQAIEGLSDEEAVGALALVLDRHGLSIDAPTLKALEPRLREALDQPEVAELAHLGSAPNPGDLARAALLHLAGESPADVERAVALRPRTERFEPTMFAVGALVLLAFRADIELRRDPGKGWHFHFRTRPLKDSTVGGILAKLAAALTGQG